MRLLLEIEGREATEVRLAIENSLKFQYKNQRVVVMNANNPKYILRNYLAQQAIEKAEKGDYSEVRRLYQLLKKPYEEQVYSPE